MFGCHPAPGWCLSLQAQDLLLDLQHQVELLFKGNASLRTSLKGMADHQPLAKTQAVQDR
jgi:hypothetical protein